MKDPRKNRTIRLRLAVLSIVSLVALGAVASQDRAAGAQNKRPMAFMDIMEMRQATAPAVAPDGKWALYTLSAPDWKAAKSFTDIYLVSLDAGLPSIRQMTFTKDKNESSPRWSRDARYFVFTSNREAPQSSANQNQLYLMRPDGGEARKITEAKDGVGSFAFSRDGRWLAFSAGKDDDQQVWILPAAEIETAKPQQLTKHATPVASWQFSPDGKRIYFISPDSSSKDDKERVEQKFTVRIRNEEAPLNHLWAVELDSKKESRLTSGANYSASNVTISKDSKWLGFRGTPKDRYQRTVTEATIYADLYLFEVATGKIERLTDNKEIGESALSFSPDSSAIAFSASDDFAYFRNNRVYVRPTAGGQWKKLGGDFDGDVSTGFWSEDGKTIYFNGRQDGRDGMERRRPLVELDSDAHRPFQSDLVRRRRGQLDFDVRAERHPTQPRVLLRRQTAL
jgi:Tol biopolymer transport system component